MHQVEEAGARQAGDVPAEHGVPGRVHRGDLAIHAGDEHQVLRQPPDAVALPRPFGDPVGQGFVHLAERGFGAALFLDIGVHADPAPQRAVGIEQRAPAARQGPAVAAIAVAQPVVDLVGGSGGDGSGPMGGGTGAVLRMHRIEPAGAEPFGLGLPGIGAPGGRILPDRAARIAGPDDLRRGLDQGTEAGLALPHRGGGGLPLGDVDDRADMAEIPACLVHPRGGGVEHPGIGPVGPPQAVVGMEFAAGGDGGLEFGPGRRPVRGMDGLQPAETLARPSGWPVNSDQRGLR